ncbi:MAG: hypothetical protein CVU49_09605 [Candidatus Cloacimonetes bacterium HGW-Cloacimonetes-2]|jgi:hypothetical protein|nr:MAG: hypothetical protein CVU49_09605 [Candidatus Cloacimonetes bacterium HGW-Cloacimonetes-2]
MKNRFKIYQILSALTFGGCIVLFGVAVAMSGGFEPPIFVLFALAGFAIAGILANLLIEQARDIRRMSEDLRSVLELLKRDQKDV